MSGEPEPPASEHPQVPTPEAGARRWVRNSQAAARKYDQNARDARPRWIENTLISLLSRMTATMEKLAREQARLSDNLDHLHRDVTALREVARVPRPECYPQAERPRRARRPRPTPPAPEGDMQP